MPKFKETITESRVGNAILSSKTPGKASDFARGSGISDAGLSNVFQTGVPLGNLL